MKALAIPVVSVTAESKKILATSALFAVVVLSLLAFRLFISAAIVATFGFLAVLERSYRLFQHFRLQRNFGACAAAIGISLFAFAAVCWVVYLGIPIRVRGGF